MSKIKPARPTEYKGIRYRSKSEAMFARFLELEIEEQVDLCSHHGPWFQNDFGGGQGGFVYEPKGELLKVNGWTPDFITWRETTGKLHGCDIPCMHYSIIEYKPSKPTQTYVLEFATRCSTILARFEELGLFEFSRRSGCCIYYGSVFSRDRGIVFAEDLEVSWDSEDWLVNQEDAIRETRFDLCEATN